MGTENGAYDTVQKEEAVTKAIKMTAGQLLFFKEGNLSCSWRATLSCIFTEMPLC